MPDFIIPYEVSRNKFYDKIVKQVGKLIFKIYFYFFFK